MTLHKCADTCLVVTIDDNGPRRLRKGNYHSFELRLANVERLLTHVPAASCPHRSVTHASSVSDASVHHSSDGGRRRRSRRVTLALATSTTNARSSARVSSEMSAAASHRAS
eukprot:PhM_4_TR16744/c1_g1_i1/m.79407